MPALAGQATRLAAFSRLPGLRVCQRTVLVPQRHAALLQQQPDLIYAVLMPWVEGPTWFQVMQEKRALQQPESLALARALAGILAVLEQKGVAHCDLSAPNLLIPGLAGKGADLGGGAIALVDVEQLYGPGLERPAPLPAGSPGYAHRTAHDGLWTAAADRFAGAVLLAEMLGWCDERVRAAADEESYFEPDEMQQASVRYELLVSVLRERWGDGLAALFDQAWHSDTLADGPTFGEWLVTLPEREATAPDEINSERQPGVLPPPEPSLADRTPSAGPPPDLSGSWARSPRSWLQPNAWQPAASRPERGRRWSKPVTWPRLARAYGTRSNSGSSA